MIKLLIQKVADAAKVQNPAKNFFLKDGLESDLVVKSGVSSDSEDAISLIWREFLLQHVRSTVQGCSYLSLGTEYFTWPPI